MESNRVKIEQEERFDQVKTTELCEEYLKVVQKILPGRIMRWGLDCQVPFVTLNKSVITSSINKLYELKNKLLAIHEDSIDFQMLIKSINYRLFEMDVLSEWQTRPYFYIERQLNFFVDIFQSELSKSFSKEWFDARIKSIPDLCFTAIENLDWQRVPSIERIWGSIKLKRISQMLEEVLVNRGESEKFIQSILKPLQEFRNRLEDKTVLHPIIKPWNLNQLERVIDDISGIKIDSEFLREKCLKIISDTKVIASQIRTKKNGIKVEKAWIKKKLQDISIAFASLFDISNMLLGSLKISLINDLNDEDINKPRASYAIVNTLTNEPSFYFFCRPSSYSNQSQLILDLVHEVYPGHHYERTLYYSSNKNNLCRLSYENIFFIEGWAKYVQDQYLLLNFDEEMNLWNKRDHFVMALKALAVLCVHKQNADWSSSMSYLSNLTDLPSEIIASILLEAYLNPIDTLAPLVGILAIQKYSEVNGIDNNLIKTGGSDLWGVLVNQ